MSGPRVHYLAPDHEAPSWGIGLLYHHVRILRELGFDACILHNRRGFRLSWLDVEVPVRYLEGGGFRPRPDDVLVVPEVLAHESDLVSAPCRRVVFVQGSFLIWTGADAAVDYRDLGYEAALAVLPHVRDIVRQHCGLTPALIPPFIAPYFFADPDELGRQREPRLVLVGKPEYRQAGYPDYQIALKVLRRHFDRIALQQDVRWELVELSGQTHRQVARTLKGAALLLNLNTLEAFNTTVPEAQAAGCVVFCYEAYGGLDFLRSGENAFVWPNNHVFPLLDRLCRMVEEYDQSQTRLAAVRAAAAKTAGRFQETRTAQALESFYRNLLR